ncbi:ricin-type beta-trefoil lectin domain protein [Actinacidiphila soli]|uniref:ricin-type beta-trefoil lectin domain protein n=1 Tax=Actinacidiphila soli TaxID=2487275 RepID=UPI000FCAA56C|nr:ricin-type beta-trefoil lectin domain protein [Actinacidiphila soli]
MRHSPTPRPPRRLVATLLSAAMAAALALIGGTPAHAAGEAVNVWLTTTNDSGGRNVTRGLQQQTPIAFTAGTSGSGQNVVVNENTKYQQFSGAGASFTDTAAYLMNSSGALTSATRTAVMQKLFDPSSGIGLSFLRNPMGASDLARYSYTYDDVAAGATDPNLNSFSISHDLVDVLPLTKQAKTLNPSLKVMGTPWTAPSWMKDNGSTSLGWLQSQYYAAYAQYFVKYVQAYAAQGVPIDYVTAQNEPTCCSGYPSMNWNGADLQYFLKNNLLPAFHSANLSTKVLALDWNWDTYASYGAPTVDDATIRNDSLFGGIAWHGYGGDVTQQTTVHNQYPSTDAFDTEHSGGTWVADQQREDMLNIIDYTRNWGKSVVKWSLAVDQNMGPHNGGCGTCTGLITVHNGDSRSGQVDYNIEYYDMGQLTKFVKPGAYRIDSTANSTVPNVAWQNPDGSKALVAYNDSTSAQNLHVVWGGQSFTYSVPAHTSATFTWSGTQSGNTAPSGPITGIAGKCADVAGAATANGTAIQLYDCNSSAAQKWTVASDGSLQALGKCMDLTSAGTANGTQVQLYDCNGTAAQKWTYTSGNLVNPASGRCLDATGASSANGTRLQIWDCTGASNQKWTVPTA